MMNTQAATDLTDPAQPVSAAPREITQQQFNDEIWRLLRNYCDNSNEGFRQIAALNVFAGQVAGALEILQARIKKLESLPPHTVNVNVAGDEASVTAVERDDKGRITGLVKHREAKKRDDE